MSRDFPATGTDFLSVGDPSHLDITGTAMTIVAWVRPDSLGGPRLVVSKATNSNPTRQYEFGMVTSSPYFAIGDTSQIDEAISTTDFVTGVWQHLAGVKNGTGAGALKNYLNGVEAASTTSNRSIATTNHSFVIGRRSSGTVNAWDGFIAELAVWDVALSAAEIAALSKGASPLLFRPQNLMGYWPVFGTGSPEPDYSGKGNHATINGTLVAAPHAPVMPFVIPSFLSKVSSLPITFDSAEAYFDITPSGVETLQAVDSAEIYFKITPSGIEVWEHGPYLDAATIPFKITPGGNELLDKPCFQGEGVPDVRFDGRFGDVRFSGSFVERFEGVLEIGAATC